MHSLHVEGDFRLLSPKMRYYVVKFTTNCRFFFFVSAYLARLRARRRKRLSMRSDAFETLMHMRILFFSSSIAHVRLNFGLGLFTERALINICSRFRFTLVHPLSKATDSNMNLRCSPQLGRAYLPFCSRDVAYDNRECSGQTLNQFFGRKFKLKTDINYRFHSNFHQI